MTREGVEIREWRVFRIANTRWVDNYYECIWPHRIDGDERLDRYLATLEEERNTQQPSYVDWFRPSGLPARDFTHSFSNERETLEKELLLAGLDLLKSEERRLRPLGYENFASLGFGGIFISYRNIANNCPLALWRDCPRPSGKNWYPLFSRRQESMQYHGG